MKEMGWQGVYSVVTPQCFYDMATNFAATKYMGDRLFKAGVHGIIALITVGENCSHSKAEKREILEAVKEAVAVRVPVISDVVYQS